MPQGYQSHGDVLTQTKDGRDLNSLWADYQAAITQWNADRQDLVDFLTYGVTEPVEEVAVPGQGSDFEEATEFGVPKSIRPNNDHFSMGFPFKWYDLAARFTWQFLADATAQQVDAVQNTALEADSRLVFNKVMKRIFDNTNDSATINGNAFNVYTFYNNDGLRTPPKYQTNTFTSSHTHYITTNGTVLQAADLDDLIGLVTEHGYRRLLGYKIVVMVNSAQVSTIRQFRMASATNTGDTFGDWDFIPSQGTLSNAILLQSNTVILGEQPSNALGNLEVVGSYGDALIVQNDYIPAGYLFCFATGGKASLTNPVGIRQHQNPQLQGMRLVKGASPDYPLIDSYYARGFGTGIRQSGAGAVLQVVTGTTYTAPTNFN